MAGVIGLDVGGTAVKSALVGPSGALVSPLTRTRIDPRGTPEAVLATLAGAAHAHAVSEADGLAIAFPGPFDYERGVAGRHDDGKFAALAGLDLGAALRERLGAPQLPLRFVNDAEAAILGEVAHGAGRGHERVLGITLGAGLGACLVEGRAIVDRAGGVVPADLYREPLGDGSADDAFSDRGLRLRLRQAGAATDDPARARCPQALAAFAAFGDDLGAFLAPRAEAVGATAVLVAGGIAEAYPLFGPRLVARLAVPVLPGELGAAAGVVGAAEALRG